MSELTNTRVPTPSNPSNLAPRYEIRKLKPVHLPWATAILAHSHGFHSNVWQKIWPDRDLGRWVVENSLNFEYLVRHQIDSGLSFGVFDTEYEFRTDTARATGGALLWDAAELNTESVEKTQGRAAESKRLLNQMDFPLVSIILSYDGFAPLSPKKMKPLLAAWPEFPILYGALEQRDQRDPASWKPTAPRQVLMRNATSTRGDYEGRGVMGAAARWLQREAALMGFRGIQIEAMADKVIRVWMEGVQKPFRGTVVSEFECQTLEVDGEGPFGAATQRIVKAWVDLTA
ncbi:hypothetical protein COCSADRAFT_35225 [Bipolaris sorokiniana ND90Pr]|uniref:Uncharacterized protein n=1 Tax=Cochliobolus sativus (strain ND90Pr / ATCC 201652) TaxID=665912 RepID=M2SWQ7_COCSN|nr:uncharacterized protein COCSADRAFT_35225 [Bipolaris sorokiniana ND90Pr]EMD66730.1 hypothetical protein COCSADRAFT_35225 [Bipolaris sorokiniana ND90Pr]